MRISDWSSDVCSSDLNQLGDWTEVHEQVMQGAVDMASQSLSTKFDKAMALTWFPYTISDYDSAREAFSRGGYVYEVIAEALDKQDTELLGVYGAGMGGAGFTQIGRAELRGRGCKDVYI